MSPTLEARLSTKRTLTAFLEGSALHPDLLQVLTEAGLDLWQAPDGFWAIRLKPTAPAPRSTRRQARRSR
jgi:hypothetical protein